jgi:hypothetical protein
VLHVALCVTRSTVWYQHALMPCALTPFTPCTLAPAAGPAGNGKWEHIGDKVPLPEAIPLKDGVYEVGRSEPADIVLNIPTVSGRHALLRVGESPASRGGAAVSTVVSSSASGGHWPPAAVCYGIVQLAGLIWCWADRCTGGVQACTGGSSGASA